jgi:hypothetical protein
MVIHWRGGFETRPSNGDVGDDPSGRRYLKITVPVATSFVNWFCNVALSRQPQI